MRAINRPNGEAYCYVSVENNRLRFKLNHGDHKGMIIEFDAKIIPELRQILQEAEFFKYV